MDFKRPEVLRELSSGFRSAAMAIDTAIQLARDQNLPYFGEIAHRQFAVLPLPSNCTTTPDFSKLIELLDGPEGLNSRTIAAEWGHLSKIRSVLAIAGGSLKLEALWTVLWVLSDTRLQLDRVSHKPEPTVE